MPLRRLRHTKGVYYFDPYGQEDLDHPKWVDPLHTREKWEYPYSYSEFFIFGDRDTIHAPGVSASYSDRLWQWNPDKFRELWGKHVGEKRWDQADRDQLSAFISAYNGKKFVVVALAEGCNPSNGYPYWIVWHSPAPEGEERAEQ